MAFFNRREHRGGNAEGAEDFLCALCVSSSMLSAVKKTHFSICSITASVTPVKENPPS